MKKLNILVGKYIDLDGVNNCIILVEEELRQKFTKVMFPEVVPTVEDYG